MSKHMRLPRGRASYEKLNRFFDGHDGADLLAQGITEVDSDREDPERMLRAYWGQPNSRQLNIRIPAAAKRMIERLARRKTVQTRPWFACGSSEAMRREARRA